MDAPALSNMQMRDVETLIHPYTNMQAHRATGGQMIERGERIYLYDDQGKRHIDGLAGLWCAGLGYNEQELIDAATEQLNRLPYYHIFGGKSFEVAIELAEKLKEKFPVPMARAFFASSGSEANDTQVKLAWYYNNAKGRPEKKKILARKKGYHGVTIVSGSLTGLPNNHRAFDLPVDRVHHTTTPHYWREAEEGETEEQFVARLASDLEALIEQEGPETIAAFIAEPVIGAGGVLVPPKGYFEAIQPILSRHDIRFIDDEVICGFGRTGEWFGSQTFNIQPDSVSLAKQLTSAYAPLSAVLVDQDMAEALEAQSGEIGTFGHGFTYGGHPVGCAVALKAIEIYESRRIPEHVAAVAPRFQQHLARAGEHPLVGEARGVGLIGALELAPDKSGKSAFTPPAKVGVKFQDEMQARGVILRALGDTVAFCPPMIIKEDEIDALFEPVEAALDATMAWARSEGLL
ncbi:MAG: aminotransferase class III-fold pyridoxal phosphate-dependent enzyme [Rhodobacteraceae bacterium]|nr:aminotransferase class III-fold pyridoxal phosphate-dependent enzyme [Paracoccaceae bacterium]